MPTVAPWTGALLWAPCDEASGSTIADQSGNGYDLTARGALTYRRGAQVLDGQSNSVGTTYTTVNADATCLYRATSPLSGDGGVTGQTWEVWIAPDVDYDISGFYANLIQQRDVQGGAGESGGTFRVALDGTSLQILHNVATHVSVITSATVVVDVGCAHQITATRLKTDAWRLYWDGAQVATDAGSATYGVSANQLSFGADYEDIRRLPGTPSEWEAFQGLLGPCYLNNKADSPSEIAARWAYGRPCGGGTVRIRHRYY